MNVFRLAPFVSLVISLAAVFPAGAQTSWKGTSGTGWSTAANWTAGVPAAGVDAIIGDASFTGPAQPTISTTGVCRSLTLGTGAKASTLTAGGLTVSGNLTIGANGTFAHSSGTTILVTGNWTNTGSYLATSANSAITFSGTTQAVAGATTFKTINVNAGCTLTLYGAISATTALKVSGTFNPNESPTFAVSGAGALTVNAGGKIMVKGATFAANYALSGTTSLNAGSTVEYAAASASQTINNTLTYGTLLISGSGTRTLAGNLAALNSTISTAGNINVSSGTLDLSTFTANRGTTVAGGSVTVAAGAVLNIGGTGTFPANYATHGLVLTSTVTYGGASQTVTAEAYGNLVLSGSSGVVTKTMPAAALVVAGNLTASNGAATTVAFTAGGALTVNGSVTLGSATTFTGGAYSNSVGGNWTNNGIFTGGTGTLTMNGANTILAGAGTNNFNHLVIARSGITADTNTSLTVAGDFSTTGAGTFTHAAGGTGTLTMSGTGKAINGTGISFNKLTITGTITTAASFNVADDLTVNGSLTASGGIIALTGTGKKIAGSGTLVFYTVQVPGSITTTNSFSLSGDLTVSGSFTATAGSVTAAGAGTFSGTVSMFNVILNGTVVHMAANSVIRIAGTSTVIAGTFDVTNSRPNTIVYAGAGSQTVYPITYDNLEIAAGGTKSSAGNVSVRGDFMIDAGAVFSGGAGGYTNYVRHNWVNYGTFTAGNSIVEMVGPANSTVTGATTFNLLRVNKDAATLVVSLDTNQTVATLDMASGVMNTGTNTLTITTTRTGGGSVFGIITRQHAFTTGTSYAFESPFNTVTFASLTSVTNVTVAAAVGSVGDFPSGGAVNRQYTLGLSSSGPYNATFRAHYEDAELNGNDETVMALLRNTGSGWILSGKTGNDPTNNWVEKSGLTNFTGRWTMSDDSSVARWNGTVSTAWETAANWTVVSGGPSLPPSTNDIVELGTTGVTYQPTIASAAKVKSISFGSAQAITLTLGSGGSLQTIGNVAGMWTNNTAHTINVGAQSLTLGNALTLSDGTNGHVINLTASSGVVTLAGALTESGGANITFTGAGTLNLGGDFIYTSGTFTPGTGTTYYTGAGNQSVGGVTYNQLVFNKPSGTASLPAAAAVNGNLTLTNGGSFRLNAPLSVAGGVVVRTNTTLTLGGSSLYVGGDWLCSGALNVSSGGLVILNGTGTQSVGATAFSDFDINKPSGAAILAGNISVVVDVEVFGGTLDLSTFAVNSGGGSALLALAAGTTLRTAGGFPTGFSTLSLDPASTVEYYASGNQTVAAATYGCLTLTSGGGNPKTLAGPTTVAGNLLIATNATLAASSNSLTLLGSWTNNGAFDGGTGTLILGGTNKTVSGGSTFNNLTVTGSYTVATNNNFTIHGNTTILGTFGGGNGTFTLDGDFYNAGSLTSGGSIIFTGTRLQTIQSITAIQAGPASVVTFNGTVSPVLNSTVPPQFATVIINNTGGILTHKGWTVFGRFQVGAGVVFDGSVYTHTFRGTVTNNGTMTSSGTLNFIPAAATTLALGGSFSSTGLVIFGGTNQLTISSVALAIDSVTIANTHASGITPASNWTLTGDFQVANGAIFHAGNGLTHTIGGNVDNDGTIDGGTSLVVFNGTTAMDGAGSTVWNNLRNSGGLTALTDFSLTGNFTNNGAFDASGQNVSFTGGTPAFIAGSTTPTTIDSLVIAKSAAAVTLALNVNGLTALTVSGGTLDTGAFSVSEDASGGSLTVAAGALLKLGGSNAFPSFTGGISLDPASTVEYAGTGAQTIGAQDYGHLTSSSTGARTLASAGTIGIAGAFTPGANSYTNTGSTVEFKGAGAQTVPAFAYNHLTSSSTGARTLAAAGSVHVAGTFTPGANSYTVTNSTVDFNGAAQTIPAFAFYNLTTAGSGAKTLGGNIDVAGALSLVAGSFADAGFTATNHGDIANAVVHSGTGKILLTGGAAAHQLSGAGVYQNLALDDTNGAALLATNLTVNGTLTLTGGQITTTTNQVIIGSTGNVARTTGYVAGLLQKTVSTGSPTLTFEVGGTNVYAPVLLLFTNVTGSGTLLVKSFDGSHPAAGSAGFTTNRLLNRYWAMTNSGTVFSNYQATFGYSTNDLDAGVAGTNLFGRSFSGGAWTNLTLGTRTATNVQTLNNTSFSEVAFGEVAVATRLGIQTQPSTSVTAGAVFPAQPVIRIENGSGGLVITDNSTVVTVARGSGGGTLQGTLTATAVNGLVTFTNLSHPVAGIITLNFTAAGLTGTNSGNITVNAGALHHFAFAAIASQTVGSAFNVALTAQDANNNTVTNFTGTVDLTTTAGAITPAVSGAFAGGLRTQSVSVTQAGGGKTITATKTGGSETGTSAGFAVTQASSALAVSTSANPSPTGSNVTFTAAVSSGAGTPTGTVQFLADGTALGSPATLSGGSASVSSSSLSHGTHTIAAQYAGDANFFGSTNGLSPNQVINASPAAANDTLPRSPFAGLQVRTATLLTNDTDPEGDALTLLSVSATSAGGGAVVVSGPWVRYTPPTGFTNSDSFTYVIADSGGLQATGTVSIAIVVGSTPSQNLGSFESPGNGATLLHFNGIPGRIYTIQYAENLQTPDWQPVGTATAGASGILDFTDTPPTNSPLRFYRSTHP